MRKGAVWQTYTKPRLYLCTPAEHIVLLELCNVSSKVSIFCPLKKNFCNRTTKMQSFHFIWKRCVNVLWTSLREPLWLLASCIWQKHYFIMHPLQLIRLRLSAWYSFSPQKKKRCKDYLHICKDVFLSRSERWWLSDWFDSWSLIVKKIFSSPVLFKVQKCKVLLQLER